MKERLIKSEACLAEGMAFLIRTDKRFETAYMQTGALPLRLRKGGFAALLDAIVGQQISVAAADSIWARLKENKLTSAKAIREADDNALRNCGLSRPKIRYARALAHSGVNYRNLETSSSNDVILELTKITGIGTWTAEIYTMFSLARADGFAPGDLALQEAARVLFELKERPSEKELRSMAEKWRPWRSVAARLLWAYYREIKNREGIRK